LEGGVSGGDGMGGNQKGCGRDERRWVGKDGVEMCARVLVESGMMLGGVALRAEVGKS